MSSCGRGVRRIVRYALVLFTAGIGVLLSGMPAAWADIPNPSWPRHCPQRIVLAVDLSESMEPNLDAVKQSARNLIDALRGAPNEVAVVTFGTNAVVSVPATNVSVDDERQRVKKDIDDLSLLRGNDGGTNWDAALTTVRTLRPTVVVLLTDGLPTAHGQPATGGSGSLDFAVRAADALKGDGTRVVGLGLGLLPENVGNLAAVTGPANGDDFYQTDASGLLNKLYDIASKACGIPVPALPSPEPGTFPIMPVIGAGVVAVIAAVGGGILLSRRRFPAAAVSTSAPSIAADDAPDPKRTGVVAPEVEGSGRGPRRISLDRFQNMRPLHQRAPRDKPNKPEAE
jgi:von Willebrand factor type A domain